MRAPPDIRRQILRIRDKNKLTMVVIGQRARVSRFEIQAALSMRATEDTLRKLDAFLDAPKLHLRSRTQSLVEHQLEKLSREVWKQFKMPTAHPLSIADWPVDRQKQYLNSVSARAKFYLQKKVLAEHSIVVKVPDGATYWQYKERCLHRIRGEEAVRTGDRDSRHIPWPRPIREERPL
jgi:hypothetical protein